MIHKVWQPHIPCFNKMVAGWPLAAHRFPPNPFDGTYSYNNFYSKTGINGLTGKFQRSNESGWFGSKGCKSLIRYFPIFR